MSMRRLAFGMTGSVVCVLALLGTAIGTMEAATVPENGGARPTLLAMGGPAGCDHVQYKNRGRMFRCKMDGDRRWGPWTPSREG